MFEDSLLESSAKMAPVLKGKHWLISIAIGAAVFLAGYFILPMVSANETSVIVTQSAIVGVVVAGFALILCYVLADAGRHGFNRGVWFVIVFLLNLVGFIIYLIYSAAKTGDWKRATLPIAYIFEVIIVGVMVLVPLIYTEALPKAQLMTFLAAPPPPPPPPPPPAAAAPAPRIIHRVSVEDMMRAPTVIPKTIAQVKDEPEPAPNAGWAWSVAFRAAFREDRWVVYWAASSAACFPPLLLRPLRHRSRKLPSASGLAARWNRRG